MATTIDKLNRINAKSAVVLKTCYDRARINGYDTDTAKKVALLALEELRQGGASKFWYGQRLRIEKKTTKTTRFPSDLYDRLMKPHGTVRPCSTWRDFEHLLGLGALTNADF